MAITDDFADVGAVADNFDCDSATGWTVTGTGVSPIATNSNSNIAGTACIELRGTAGLATWYQEPSAGNSFKITSESLNVWFYYAKGKGANLLGTSASDLVIRLYFNGTFTEFADYYPTDAGNDSLNFGWQLLHISGKNLNGGTFNFTDNDTNWNRDITRVEIRLDINEANNGGSDPLMAMDSWFTGTKMIVSAGTPATPQTLGDLFEYQKQGGTRNSTSFPLGLLQLDVLDPTDREQVFARFRCGLDIGDGTDGTGNEGNLDISSTFVLFDQWSQEVTHNLVVKNFSTLQFGEKESVTGAAGTSDVAVRGCQVVLPEVQGPVTLATATTNGGRYEIRTVGTTNWTLIGAPSNTVGVRFTATGAGTGTGDAYLLVEGDSDVSVENGGVLNIYDTKFFRWRDIFLGAASDTTSNVDIVRGIFDSCETIYFRANTLNLRDIEIYNNAQNDRNWCAEMAVEPDSSINFLVHDCEEGMHFKTTLSMDEYIAQDNTIDLRIENNETATLVNSEFGTTIDKLKRVGL